MKIKKILKKISLIIIMMAICLCNFSMCYAKEILPNKDSYKPTVQGGGVLTNATNKILGAIIIIGVVLITVFIGITGFETILGSSEEKAVAKEKFGGYLIAAIILTGGATIARIIIAIAGSF